MIMTSYTSRFLVVAAWSLMFSLGVSAQIEVPRITILDEEPRDFRIGDLFRLHLDKDELSAAGGGEGLRVRVFRSSKAELLAARTRADSSECLVFFSDAYGAVEYNGGIQVVRENRRGIVFTIDWLKALDEDRSDDETYVLVLELDSPTEDTTLLLNTGDLQSYFGRGHEFVVEAPSGLKPRQRRDLYAKYRQALEDSTSRFREVLGLSVAADPAVEESETKAAPPSNIGVPCHSIKIVG